MARRRAFDMCHPSVNLLYFLLVLVCSVGCMHPACLGISLGGALACGLLFRGRRAVGRLLGLLGPVALLAAGGNLLLVRQGETVLARLPGGRPLTLESALYGLAAACLLGAVVLWFASWQAVLTADKITYLFGRIAPALALLLSLTLSFVPRLRRRLEETDRAQRGLLGQPRRRLDKVGWGAALLSSLLGWSLENAIETADTMRSRGYGLPGRTCFSIYRLDRRDKGLLGWLALSGGYVVAGWAAGETLRALARNWQVTEKEQAAAAMARLLTNAVPAFLPDGKLLPFLRVNSLSANCGTKDCFAPGEADQTAVRTLGALMCGFAAAVRSAVTVTEDGVCVNMYLPGTYKLRVQGEKAKLHVAAEGEKITLTLEAEKDVELTAKVYIPAWAKDACVQLNDEGGDAPAAGKLFTVPGKLHGGDLVTVLLPCETRMEEGYHQSVSVLRGDELLAYPVTDEHWRVALVTAKDGAEGSVAALKRVTEWNTRVHTPADPPIAPKCEGEAFEAALAPFAQTVCRVAAFPKGKQA